MSLPIVSGIVASGLGAFIVLRNVRSSLPARAGRRRRLPALDPDDGQLAHQHLKGDPRAFGALVDRYQSRLLTFINRVIGDRERAEDLVQEAFIRVRRHLPGFDRTRKFSSWIYTIASSLAEIELASRRENPPVRHRLELQDGTPRPLVDAVAVCVRQLPESLRGVFILRELEGMSYEEIAEITGCTVGTVRGRLSEARTSFARVVEPLVN